MKALSLFSGIGGIDLACEWAGIETVAFCEREPFPQKVLKKHWPNVPIYDDVRTLTRERLEEDEVIIRGRSIDLIHGGFPCQPFSTAGSRKGKDDDRDLWPEMFRVIREIKPTWVLGENVANFAGMELERTVIDLEGEGYEVQTFIIPACAVNAPHRRDRTFVVAYADNNRSQESGWETKTKQDSYWENYRLSLQNSENEDAGRWLSDSGVRRVANGIPDRVDRITALGNAVVPLQIYPILKVIADIEKALED